MKVPASSAVLCAFVATLCLCQDTADPWPKAAVIEPAALAQILEAGNPPVVISVAFPTLYRAKHIVHAVDAGPTSKPDGIEALKKAVRNLQRDADIVIYCGCCPMEKCPNVRPAYRTLKELGFTHVRVLDIATNMHTDWYSKDYPSENGPAATSETK
jgi:thiosulfate/3-mercaptopyruvate sulfurtransferase